MKIKIRVRTYNRCTELDLIKQKYVDSKICGLICGSNISSTETWKVSHGNSGETSRMHYPYSHIESTGLIPKTSTASFRIFVDISRSSESVRLNIPRFSFKRSLEEFDELEKDAKVNNTAFEMEEGRIEE